MSDRHVLDDVAVAELEVELNTLYPERALDASALDRAFDRISAHMTDEVVSRQRTRSVLFGTPIRRRLVTSLATAAVVMGTLVGLDRSSSPTPTASGTTDQVLTQLVGYYKALPAAQADSYVKVTTTSTIVDGSGIKQSSNDVVYRPADLTDTNAPWVWATKAGPVKGLCGNASTTKTACAAGTWADPDARFVAQQLKSHTPLAVASAYVGRLGTAGVDKLMFDTFSWLQQSAGNPQLAETIFDIMRLALAHDPSISLHATTRANGTYVITYKSATLTDVWTIDPKTGDLSDSAKSSSSHGIPARSGSSVVVIGTGATGPGVVAVNGPGTQSMTLKVHSEGVPATSVPGLNGEATFVTPAPAPTSGSASSGGASAAAPSPAATS